MSRNFDVEDEDVEENIDEQPISEEDIGEVASILANIDLEISRIREILGISY